MNITEAISFVSRYEPCPHDSTTKLGTGEYWAKCEDCGATIDLERTDERAAEVSKFEEAMEEIIEAVYS